VHNSDLVRGLGFFVAALGPLAVAALMVPLRTQPVATELAFLAMMYVVGAAGVMAGFRGGGSAAVMATLSFDFFFSRPRLELNLDSADDGRKAILLLSVGFGAAALAHRQHAARSTASLMLADRANSSKHIQRVVDLIAQGVDPRDLISAVQAELTVLLLLRSCRFETGEPAGCLPHLERNGTISTGHHPRHHGDGRRPASEFALLVQAGGVTVGRFVLDPSPGTSLLLEHRIVALILADHLGAAIAAHAPLAVHGGKPRLGADRRGTRPRRGPVPPIAF
jgi:hypothetical protein